MRRYGLGLKSYRTNLTETSLTGTVNLHKHTVKDSNNLSILILIANFEFCILYLVNGRSMLELS